MKTIIEFFDPPVMRLCLLIAAGMLWLAGYNLIAWTGVEGTTWAAWVQAVGSVAAILAAFSISNAQVREQAFHSQQMELEAAVRAATFGNQVAQRTQAAVNNLIGVLADWRKDTPFHYDSKYLDAAEALILMALERDLPAEQTVILISFHNDLLNILQGVSEIRGIIDPLGYRVIAEKIGALFATMQMATIDTHFMLKAAEDALSKHRDSRSRPVR